MNPYQLRLMTLAFVVIGGVLLVGVFLFGMQHYFRPALQESLAGLDEESRSADQAGRRTRPPISLSTDNGRQQFLREQHLHEVAQLRSMLEEKAGALRKQQLDLQQTQAEKERLQVEIDSYIDLLLTKAADQKDTDANADGNLSTEATEQIRSEAFLDAEIGAYIADVAGEIQRQQQRISELERSLAAQAENTLIAQEVISEMGSTAVPLLVTMLLDDRAAYRRWSATMLRDMGPAAAPAKEALQLLTDDEDLAVRQAVREAIQQIELGL